MKHWNDIRPLFLAFLAIAVNSAHADTDRVSKIKPPCCQELKAGVVYSDRSLYQLESKWTSDMARDVRLGVLHGKPQLVAMVFTSCEYACPIIVNDLKRIESALPENVRTNVGLLLISFDHERDTPKKLNDFRKRMELPLERWTLLRGDADDVRELAALLGVNYRKEARGQYAHSNVISLLNTNGEVVFQQSGLNIPTGEFVKRLGVMTP
jgi:protein SCO1/2